MIVASPLYHQNMYAPVRPSPLSEHPANVPSRIFNFNMASQEKRPMPQRPYKPNPVLQNRDAATQRRRDMFFRRVQNDRADKRWEARGDQIQRLDFIKHQKRWEDAKAQQAPEESYDTVEENVMEEAFATLPSSPMQANVQHTEQEMSEADYILAQEQYELDALIASMEEQEQVQSDNVSHHYGSDDEDYDQIFTQWTSDSDFEQQQQPTIMNGGLDDGDAMDMS